MVVVLAACSSNTETKNSEEEAQNTADENVYVLNTTQFTSSGMKLGKLENREFHEVVKANGVFDVPPENTASVSSYFGGTVKNITLLSGERVKKGQVLFTLENPDYVQLQQDYLEAKGQLAYLQSDYERQKNLVQDNITSQKNYLKAESDYVVTKVKVESLAKKLALMNINPNGLSIETIRSSVNIISPISGYVTRVDVTRGSYLNPSQHAVTIVNTDHLHLELNIFEKDISKVHIGQTIQFSTQSDKSKKFNAIVHLVNKTVDSDNRTIGLHGHLVDEKLSAGFNPGVYVEADILTITESRLALPEEAIVEVENKYFALVLTSSSNDGYTFVKKEIKTGSTGNGYTEILNSIDFGENTEFLIKGAFNLITE